MSLEQIIQNSVAPVIIAALFLWFMDRSEKQRQDAAKQLSQERREYESTVFNMFANTMKQMITEVTSSNEKVVTALSEHEKASQERYERMGNTQEIMDKLEEMKRQQHTQRRP